jgi:hypothetical protein
VIDPPLAAGHHLDLRGRSAQRQHEEGTRQLLLEQKAILDNASIGILFTNRRWLAAIRAWRRCSATRQRMIGQPSSAVFPS